METLTNVHLTPERLRRLPRVETKKLGVIAVLKVRFRKRDVMAEDIDCRCMQWNET